MSSVLRLGLFYAALFVGTGASSPYIPVWFAHRGLSGAEIGAILSAPMLARVISGPAIALWADSFRLRRTPLSLIGVALAILYAVLAAPFGFVWWFGVWFMASSLMSTLIRASCVPNTSCANASASAVLPARKASQAAPYSRAWLKVSSMISGTPMRLIG